ncbi:MAG TPA: NFACT RNA binding domain-containing protein [Gemmatimonadaceae bacterium]|nr:NFACT RNA binding domain-containing protein [Gemmatimonadaceae bacterium]
MDSLTAFHLARELDARWKGGTIRAGHLDRDARRVVIGVLQGAAVEIDLSAPAVEVRERRDAEGGGPLAGWMIESVSAPEDDRRLMIALTREGKFKGSVSKRALLEVSMLPQARAARAHESGRAFAQIGGALPARSVPRPVLSDDVVRAAAMTADSATLMSGRWVSPIVARWLVSNPDLAPERYREICALGPARPAWCGAVLVAFPMCDDAVLARSLIAPASPTDDESAAPSEAPGAPTDPRRERALERMRRELARAADAPRLRLLADALMSLGDVPAPATVRLSDESEAGVERREGESAVHVAERLYDDVRSMERALTSLPERIAAFERAPAALDAAAPATQLDRQAAARGPARPFRTYRSTGGLEIWVGRGAASNDALTFHESSPRDVWLHARDSAGAHVVLRWTHDDAPPSRDLEEAAVLAAWHSKSRASGLVPVDWTRRKYVRKARGGPPGQVLVQRAETIFVEPDERVERRLRDT